MSFSALFYPKAIAVVGASRRIKTVGNDIVKNLVTQGFQGKIYPVNPKADVLYGQPVLQSIDDIPGKIDLVVVAVPAPFVSQVIIEAHAKGAQAAIVISAGCKEIGKLDLEIELTKVCAARDISLVGPNCLGIINPEIQMNASFAGYMPRAGNVAFVSQSGALCTAVLDHAATLGIGFSKFLSIGNKADINELKLLKYFARDPKTKVMALYVEQLENAPAFIELARQITTGKNAKPIIMLKSGRTSEGAGAIASHTGSLSGGDTAYEALFAQAGIIRADNMNQLFDLIQVFSKHELSPVKNTAIITNAGGPGVLTTDQVVESGLKLSRLSEKTQSALREFLPDAASLANPVDILGDAVGDRYQKTLELVVADPQVDSVILLLTPQSMTEIERTAKSVALVRANTKKPILVSFMGDETVAPGVKIMRAANVVTTAFPESAAAALAKFGKFEQRSRAKSTPIKTPSGVKKANVAKIFDRARGAGQTSFPEAQALEILSAYNFPLLSTGQAASATEAKAMVQKLSGKHDKKYAMKIVSPDILHKSDVGGVALNVTLDTVEAEFEAMMKRVSKAKPKAKLEGVLLMEMAPTNGLELIVGVNKVEGLGSMIMVGLGGIYVEVFKDVAFGFAPLSSQDIERMIGSLKSAALLEGTRGQNPRDTKALLDTIARVNQLVIDFPEIVELDINPLLVLDNGQGVRALDARIVIEES